ncbi:rho guanine nucleotide exchange factor 19 [Amia ocellicauda]|uniref:rho guanine nucleotide exchange factor 19 n=1 Tax=Amia ocellicauda TaxID=2972642 RepID=UPI0034640050
MCPEAMLPGYGFPPLPDFQPHLQAFPYRRESVDMWIPGSPESPARGEGLKDGSFPRHHHIAVCKQETLTFIELPALPPEPTGGHRSPSLDRQGPCFDIPEEWPNAPASWSDPRVPMEVQRGGRGSGGDPCWSLSLASMESEGLPAPPGRPPLSLSLPLSPLPPPTDRDSYPSSSPTSSLGSGLRSPELCRPQRRPSQGSVKEKNARRKMRVYSPESLSDESLSSPSLECEYLFPGPFLEEELGPPPCPALPLEGAGDNSSTGVGSELPAPEDRESGLESLDSAEEMGGPGSRGFPGVVVEQERRRFSASELISRLQLSQRKSSFTLKLGKSLSARVTHSSNGSKDRPHPLRSLSPDSKHSSRDRSSAGSIDSAPHSPMGPGPPLPSGDSASILQRRSSRPSFRRDSVEEGGMCTPASFSCTKRLSRFLPNSILYQEYSDVAINREIQRQQGAEPGTEEEEEGEREGGGGGGGQPSCNLSPSNSFRSQRSSRGSAFSLWQDIPDVRSSGLLDTFSNDERKLQEAKFELVTSEASYIRSLSIAVDHFMLSRELSDCLGTQERQWLFSKLPEVKDVSERFLLDLELRLEEDILRFDVCDIVLAHCPALRRVYLPYVTNQAYQEQTYQRLLHENPRFPGILARLEEDPVCQRLPLTSFLILPFQRITRLKMLVENILKRTAPGSRDEDTATKAFNELKKLIKECNSSVQSMKRTEELIHLNKKIHFESKIFPLISQSRWLVKHGELLEVDTQSMSISGTKFKLPTRPVYLHLFNDCLLLSRKKEAVYQGHEAALLPAPRPRSLRSTWKFAVFVHAKIGQLKVKDLSQKVQGFSGYIFHLQLCDGPQLKHQILLKAHTESEKQRWITAMLPPDPEGSREQISENEDRSQVQCIKSYKAQEHDELTLEKADILQVKTLTSDGWVEGIRLSDGERGWFPQSYVEEITSRSARLRNLRENNRIKCATQKLEEEYL